MCLSNLWPRHLNMSNTWPPSPVPPLNHLFFPHKNGTFAPGVLNFSRSLWFLDKLYQAWASTNCVQDTSICKPHGQFLHLDFTILNVGTIEFRLILEKFRPNSDQKNTKIQTKFIPILIILKRNSDLQRLAILMLLRLRWFYRQRQNSANKHY